MESIPRRSATNEEPQIIAVSSINRSARRAWLRISDSRRQSCELCRKASCLTTPSVLGMLGRFSAFSGLVARQPCGLHALFTVPWTVPLAGIHITKTGFTIAAFEILIADDHPLFRSALQQDFKSGHGESCFC